MSQQMPPPYQQSPMQNPTAPPQNVCFQPAPVPVVQPVPVVCYPPAPPQSTTTNTTVVVNSGQQGQTGSCPVCKTGHFQNDYLTLCGLFWFIVCFPLGAICLYTCRKRSCGHCGFTIS